MDLIAVLKLAPVVLTFIEMVKRIIPDKQRTIANPVLAVLAGLTGAYMTGGQSEVVNVLITGVLAGATAIGAYKIPKEIGARMGIE